MHSEHTQGTQATRALRLGREHSAVSWRTGRLIVAPLRPCRRRVLSCRRAHARVVEPCHVHIAPCCSLSCCPCHDTRHRISTLEYMSRVSQCSCAVIWLATTLYRTIVSWPPSHDTKFVSRHTPWPSRAPALPLTPAGGPAVSLPLTGRIMGSCRKDAGYIVAPCCAPLRAYVTIQPIVS